LIVGIVSSFRFRSRRDTVRKRFGAVFAESNFGAAGSRFDCIEDADFRRRDGNGIFVQPHRSSQLHIVPRAVGVFSNVVGVQYASPMILYLCASKDQEIPNIMTKRIESLFGRVNGLANTIQLSRKSDQLTYAIAMTLASARAPGLQPGDSVGCWSIGRAILG
jgi:hypothetical protein